MDRAMSPDESASMVGIRALAKQVDRLEKWIDKAEEVKLPELAEAIHRIELRLAGGFVTDEDCEACRKVRGEQSKARVDYWLRVIPIVISITALAAAIYLKA